LGVVHGEAVGVMLPHIIRFNAQIPEIAAIYQTYLDGDLAARVSDLLAEAKMPNTLCEHGVKTENLSDLAEMAAKQWTAQFNPRELSVEDFAYLYRAAL
jgi:alcohol dehydrogenase